MTHSPKIPVSHCGIPKSEPLPHFLTQWLTTASPLPHFLDKNTVHCKKLPNLQLKNLSLMHFTCNLTCLISQALLQAALDEVAEIFSGWVFHYDFLSLLAQSNSRSTPLCSGPDRVQYVDFVFSKHLIGNIDSVVSNPSNFVLLICTVQTQFSWWLSCSLTHSGSSWCSYSLN
jgi:hypothetical protein